MTNASAGLSAPIFRGAAIIARAGSRCSEPRRSRLCGRHRPPRRFDPPGREPPTRRRRGPRMSSCRLFPLREKERSRLPLDRYRATAKLSSLAEWCGRVYPHGDQPPTRVDRHRGGGVEAIPSECRRHDAPVAERGVERRVRLVARRLKSPSPIPRQLARPARRRSELSDRWSPSERQTGVRCPSSTCPATPVEGWIEGAVLPVARQRFTRARRPETFGAARRHNPPLRVDRDRVGLIAASTEVRRHLAVAAERGVEAPIGLVASEREISPVGFHPTPHTARDNNPPMRVDRRLELASAQG